MNTEIASQSNSNDGATLVEKADIAIHEYQSSRVFAEDLVNAFTTASQQAREENERLGLLPTGGAEQVVSG